MENIRIGVFETNSSSVHSCTFCFESEWEAFHQGKMPINSEEEKFISREEYNKLAPDQQRNYLDYTEWNEWIYDAGLEVTMTKWTNREGLGRIEIDVDGYNG